SDAVDTELAKHVDDPDVHVRLQLAYTLGQLRDPQAGKLLATLAVHDSDVHLTAAVLSSLRADNLPVVMDAVAHADKSPALLAPRLAAMVAAVGDRALVNETVQRLLTASRPSASQIATLAGLLDALDRRGSTVKGLVDSSTEQQLREALSQSRRRVLDD